MSQRWSHEREARHGHNFHSEAEFRKYSRRQPESGQVTADGGLEPGGPLRKESTLSGTRTYPEESGFRDQGYSARGHSDGGGFSGGGFSGTVSAARRGQDPSGREEAAPLAAPRGARHRGSYPQHDSDLPPRGDTSTRAPHDAQPSITAQAQARTAHSSGAGVVGKSAPAAARFRTVKRRREDPEEGASFRRKRMEERYDILNRIGSGSYGVVLRGRRKESGEIVALKVFKKMTSTIGLEIELLRELSALLKVNHPNLISAQEVCLDTEGKVVAVMEYIEHELRILLSKPSSPFALSERKRLVLQLLDGVNYLHTHDLVHRDLKSSNLLYSNQGLLKICDYGCSRRAPGPQFVTTTPNVGTLWYRSPEELIGCSDFDAKASDMWAAGCILAEIFLNKHPFKGANPLTLLSAILEVTGTPAETWREFWESSLVKCMKVKPCPPAWNTIFKQHESFGSASFLPASGLDLLQKLLALDPRERLTAREAMRHPFFSEVPLPRPVAYMPGIRETNNLAEDSRSFRPDDEEEEVVDGAPAPAPADSRYRMGRRVDPRHYFAGR